MNKAFVREPDEPDLAHCPVCGAVGQPVSDAAVKRQTPADRAADISTEAFFCISPRCVVGYFDAHGRTVPADVLGSLVYPKREDAPICACRGIAADDVIADARANNPKRVREIIAHCRAHPEECAAKTVNERPCEEQVQKLYLKHLQKG